MKVVATINHVIDKDTAEYIVKEFGHSPIFEDKPNLEIGIKQEKLKLAKNAKQGDPVEVTYSYDTNGVMHCVFKEVKSKNTHEMELKPEGSKDFKELKKNLDFDIE